MKKGKTPEQKPAQQQDQNAQAVNSGTDVRERLRAMMLERIQSSPRPKGNENINTLNSASSRIPVLDKKFSDNKESPARSSKVSL